MTPNQRVNTGGTAAMIISALAGIWLFISPWIYGFGAATVAWNNWVVGALIVALGMFNLRHPQESALVWLLGLLGLWTFCTPWLYHFTFETAPMVNSFIVGAIVFLLAVAVAAGHGRHQHPATPAV